SSHRAAAVMAARKGLGAGRISSCRAAKGTKEIAGEAAVCMNKSLKNEKKRARRDLIRAAPTARGMRIKDDSIVGLNLLD
ncbi:MAG: hypothetical protein WA191_01525, partial [Telluria sp.]